MDDDSEGELEASKQPCPCGASSDAFALYTDGHGYCFSGKCDQPYWSPKRLGRGGDAAQDTHSYRSPSPMSADLLEMISALEARALPKRKITQATARHWDYRIGVNSHGEGEHWAIYHDEHGVAIGAKVRNVGKDGEGKEFEIRPNPKHDGVPTPALPLYGIQRLSSHGGKMLIVAEGEIDTLTASQLWANKFPVVGVPNGASNARKDIAHAIGILSAYDKVVFAFDMDEPGRNAAVECARLLPPGKAFIANIPGGHKDIGEAHVAGMDQELIAALFNAPAYRPDGIVAAKDLVGKALNPSVNGLSYPWEFLTEWTHGMRDGDVIVIGAGTGVGKSDFQAEMVAHLIAFQNTACAVFNYEASPVRTLKAIAGKLASMRFHIPQDHDGDLWTEEALRETLRAIVEDHAKLFINDSYGAVDWESIKERMRYLRHAEGVFRFFIDPVAALVAQEDDDRKALDKLFAEAKSLAEELSATIIFNSHLTRPSEGKSHEEGGRVTLKNFRGSGAITMWAALVLGMERNQQAEDAEERTITILRCLKERETGDSVGSTKAMFYNVLTGRLELAAEDDSMEPPPSTLTDEEALAAMAGDDRDLT